MADATAIQWTDATWNPVTGCTKVSRGCRHCYIDRTPPFRMAGRQFVRGTTGVQLHPDRLDVPLRWRTPRRVFVCSLADLFHDAVPEAYLEHVFRTMGLAPAHTFQVLTKRPERALEFLRDRRWRQFDYSPQMGGRPCFPIIKGEHREGDIPLPNVWIGVSIEDANYTWRADVLRQIPAAVRFISAEPLLGSLYEPEPWQPPQLHDWRPVLSGTASAGIGEKPGAYHCARCKTFSAFITLGDCDGEPGIRKTKRPLDLSGIDWVIAGAESGHGARPMDEQWVREIRDACTASDADVAFFYKQNAVNGRKIGLPELDGRQWTEFPR